MKMKNINTRKWSTPMIIGAGLFVSVTGVLMLMGIHNPIQFAHEWVGLVFVIAILLHVLNHWSAFKNYFSQPLALSLLGLVAMVSSTFVFVSSTQGDAGPMMKMVHSIEASSITEVAPLLDETAQNVVLKMQAAGFRVEGIESSIKEIATVNGSEPRALIKLLFSGESS
jgi:hypothetical protein